MDTITWQDFAKIDIRVGTIIAVEDFPEARKPAYPDFAMAQNLGSSISAEAEIGKIGPFISECLTTGFYRPDGAVVLAVPEQLVPNGTKLA